MNKETILKYFLVILVFLGSFFGTRFIIENFFENKNNLKNFVIDINKNCPKKISETIVLDSVSANEKDFNYFYTLVYQNKEVWNDAEFQNFMKPKLIETYQKSEEKSIINQYNFNLVYHYQDGFKESISKIIITPKEYQK